MDTELDAKLHTPQPKKEEPQPVAWVWVKDGRREVIWMDEKWFKLKNGTLLYVEKK